MKIGLFGGSFDPVHFGHLSPLSECRVQWELDTIFYLPAHRPPHKMEKTLSSAFHRMAMLALALQGMPETRIETLELASEEGRYTVDTVEALKLKWGAEIFLIIGSDNLAILPTWHDVPRLLTLCKIIVLNRPGITYREAVDRLPPELASFCGGGDSKIVTFTHDPVDISASLIREKVSRGESIAGLTPWPVELYIRRNHLYA